ncbi:hypothetical protein ACFQI7_28795 [Paenibacillus allorhizosphaerae]|uniref:YfhD family protein n=1 Tax=Paenibacillus allorhizosphaerae TaxID=2849866 RepID=A0ABN7TT73_9BACL|nr:hypothetical protein [Paenibacillus allorhizosphaerae]CAG7650125.1 hypothetical protein PAECIP111802_04645 [Paenibacillus allorhizosphaerae]
MTSSRNHQGAHGIGQAEEQLNQQAEAAEAIQGTNETDQEVLAAANRNESELDEIIERQSD